MLNITLINGLLIALSVVIHYEALRWLSRLIPRLNIAHRMRLVVGVYGALTAHVLEVWLFGLGYYIMHLEPSLGALQGNYSGSLLDSVYFSFTSYTSLGYGDIEPVGPLRFTAGLESLTGLVLIGWTASFLYVEMTRFWDEP
ncbi:MAG: two pore domain potassium channel family protein [Pseudomonadales bacterium]|nr:two pore domain potassium channel family protein [Pseudomonadales bacterium]